MIRKCARLWPRRHKAYSGNWAVTWTVQSDTFPEVNTGVGELYCLGKAIAIEVEFVSTDGTKRAYHFVGNSISKVITGEWLDGVFAKDGYYGSFQLVANDMGNAASGKWLGFSSSNSVKSGPLVWQKRS